MNLLTLGVTQLLRARSSLAHTSPKAKGLFFAVITIIIWVSFIIIARASSHGTLTGLDIAALRILGASSVLIPIGFWINKSNFESPDANGPSSFWGLSPLNLRLTMQMGLAGGLLYAVFSYSGFFFAPAAHASVLLPGSLPLWTTLIAWVVISQPINTHRMLGLFIQHVLQSRYVARRFTLHLSKYFMVLLHGASAPTQR